MERLLDKRVVLTLADGTVRIFGSDCQRVLATPDLQTVDLRVGVNGQSRNETFQGVTNVFYEGPLERLVRQTVSGELNIQYPQRLARLEFNLSDGSLVYLLRDDVEPTRVEAVNALVFE